MTAFDELERGDIIWGTDPLSDKGRPMLVLRTPRFPNHGLQLITVLISTKADGETLFTHALSASLSGAPGAISGGVVAPLVDGRVLFLDRTGAVGWTRDIGATRRLQEFPQVL